MAEMIVPKRTYVVVWAVLMCLTALTAGVSLINLGQWSTVIALVIAAAKASLVVAFFMHLLYEKQKMIWVWAAVSAVWLVLLLLLTMNDYLTRGFLRVPGK
jgi:cytochrome c oxidase subunit IV